MRCTAFAICPNQLACTVARCLQSHATTCPAEPASTAAAAVLRGGARKGHNGRGALASRLQVPPKLHMYGLKEKDVKQKLKQYSLPTHGKKQVTIPCSSLLP